MAASKTPSEDAVAAPVGSTASGPASGQADWIAIREAYEAGDEPVAALCLRFGITAYRLYRTARTGDWARRRERPYRSVSRDGKGGDAGAVAVPDRLPPIGAEDRRVLIERLYRACEAQIADVERRFAGDGEEARAREGDARHLAALVQTLSKLTALDQASRETETADRDTAVDIDDLRAKLARRLDRLRARNGG